MRRVLDTLYRITLWLSALCLVAIALMVGAQLAGRLIDGTLALLRLPRTDFVILSLNEICGYLLAAASFLALAGTLKAGAHIRVTMVLGVFSESVRRIIEIWAFGFAAAASGYMTCNLVQFRLGVVALPRGLARRGPRAAGDSAGGDGGRRADPHRRAARRTHHRRDARPADLPHRRGCHHARQRRLSRA